MIIKAEELKIVYEKGADGRIRPVYFIDAVPVVRCKDCRYSNTSLVSDKIVCVYFDDAIYGMQENDFCSRGERRTDE